MPLYDAFISYSHAKDKPIAAALQSVVQKLGKPWYRRRALRVFRDDTSLSATPSLWPSIEQALQQSRFFILLASSEAAASKWVNREVSYWLENKSLDTMLIAVTDGDLAWDESARDFGPPASTQLPAALIGRFPAEPKWVDLRAYRDGADPGNAKFIELGADFAATIHGTPKEDILSQEVRQQRRALTLAWSMVAALALFIALASWQWWEAEAAKRAAITAEGLATKERKIAVTQRDRAEANLDTATWTANRLVFDLSQEFKNRRGMPIELVLKILARAQDLQQKLYESGELSPSLQHSEAVTLHDLARTYMDLGDTKSALETSLRARDIMDKLVAAKPNDKLLRTNQGVTYGVLGHALVATGKDEEALTVFREGLAISLALASENPDDNTLQRDLVVTHSQIGELLGRAGRPEEALENHQTGWRIAEKLAAIDPRNAGAQRDLASSYNYIGALFLSNGRSEQAISFFQKSLGIRKRLAAADPNNTEWQRDLAVCYSMIGQNMVSLDQADEALDAYREAHGIIAKLLKEDPNSAQLQTDYFLGLYVLGVLGDDPKNNLANALSMARKLQADGKLVEGRKIWIKRIEQALSEISR